MIEKEISLLPCPFCGGEAQEHIEHVNIWISCTSCGASTNTFGDLEMSGCRKAWNTRHENQKLLAEKDKCIAKLEEFVKACKQFGVVDATDSIQFDEWIQQLLKED